MKVILLTAACALSLIAGCQSVPSGPSVLVLPGQGRDFQTFSRDDATCRQFAMVQIDGKSPAMASGESLTGSAALGSAVGAASGAALGGGSGAAMGAGAGLLGGSTLGAGLGYQAGMNQQQRYDHGYIQCMYARGHQVPIQGVIAPVSAAPRQSSTSLPLPPRDGMALPPSKPPGQKGAGAPTSGRMPLPPAP